MDAPSEDAPTLPWAVVRPVDRVELGNAGSKNTNDVEARSIASARRGETPLIVTGCSSRWRGLETLTFDLLKAEYSGVLVQPVSHQVQLTTTLADYIAYILDHEAGRPAACGGIPAEYLKPPAYLQLTARDLAQSFPELFRRSIAPFNLDFFLSDWLARLPGPLNRLRSYGANPFFWLYIGPKGTLSPTHYDPKSTHAASCQVRGRKKWLLFPPGDAEFLYTSDRNARFSAVINAHEADFREFPLLAKATPYYCVVNPGEMLLLPTGWWHSVISLDASITFGYDFVNSVNVSGFLKEYLKSEAPVVLAQLSGL